MRERVLLTVFLLALLAFGFLLARKYLVADPAMQPAPVDTQAALPASQREVLLYFPLPGATYLVAEGRDIRGCQLEEDCLRSTVQALIEGPAGDLAPVIPRQTRLRELRVEGDLVVVDFSRDFVNGHPGGSLSELLTVYSLIDSLAVNFPYVRQLRILVEGEPLDTIKGHVDLRAPVTADFKYTRSVEPAESLPLELIEGEPSEPADLPRGVGNPPR